MPLPTHASPTSSPTLLNFSLDQNLAKSCKMYFCHHSSSSMHPCCPHRLSPLCHMPHLHHLFHHHLLSSSFARVQQNLFLHRLASCPPVVTSLHAQCTQPHLHTRAHCLPCWHPLTLSCIALVHHAHHQPHPRTSASHRLVALVLFRHFPAPISHPCRSRFPVPPSKQSISPTSRQPFHLSFRSNLRRSHLPHPQHSISHRHHFHLQLSTRHPFQPLPTLCYCSRLCPF